MKKGFRIIQSSTGVSPYMWALFTKLSFYFIFQWSTTGEIVTANHPIHLFLYFLAFRFYFKRMGKILLE